MIFYKCVEATINQSLWGVNVFSRIYFVSCRLIIMFSESNSEEETGEDNPVFDQLMEKVAAIARFCSSILR